MHLSNCNSSLSSNNRSGSGVDMAGGLKKFQKIPEIYRDKGMPQNLQKAKGVEVSENGCSILKDRSIKLLNEFKELSDVNSEIEKNKDSQMKWMQRFLESYKARKNKDFFEERKDTSREELVCKLNTERKIRKLETRDKIQESTAMESGQKSMKMLDVKMSKNYFENKPDFLNKQSTPFEKLMKMANTERGVGKLEVKDETSKEKDTAIETNLKWIELFGRGRGKDCFENDWNFLYSKDKFWMWLINSSISLSNKQSLKEGEIEDNKDAQMKYMQRFLESYKARKNKDVFEKMPVIAFNKNNILLEEAANKLAVELKKEGLELNDEIEIKREAVIKPPQSHIKKLDIEKDRDFYESGLNDLQDENDVLVEKMTDNLGIGPKIEIIEIENNLDHNRKALMDALKDKARLETLLDDLSTEQSFEILKSQDRYGKTVLHHAIVKDSEEYVGLLFSKLNIDQKFEILNIQDDKEEKTILHYASEKGNINLIEMLVYGLSIDQKIKALKIGTKGVKKTPLHYAAEQGRKDCIEVLVSGLNVDQKFEIVSMHTKAKKTALHLAAARGCRDCVALLLSGLSGDQKSMLLSIQISREKRTPLHVAAANGHTDCIEALVNGVGSDLLAANLGLRQLNGNTPLHNLLKNREQSDKAFSKKELDMFLARFSNEQKKDILTIKNNQNETPSSIMIRRVARII